MGDHLTAGCCMGSDLVQNSSTKNLLVSTNLDEHQPLFYYTFNKLNQLQYFISFKCFSIKDRISQPTAVLCFRFNHPLSTLTQNIYVRFKQAKFDSTKNSKRCQQTSRVSTNSASTSIFEFHLSSNSFNSLYKYLNL